MTTNPVRLSDALRLLMRQKRYELQAQKGQPDQGKCCDCKRWVKATEIAAKCPKCDEYCCVNCVDNHDHMHVALAQMGMATIPRVIGE